MKNLQICLIFLLSITTKCQSDDRFNNVQQIVEENGFKFESYDVVTQDGYILQIHRIVPDTPSPVVLLQHGIEDSSVEFIINSPDKAPAFLLAHAGFDVWLGNNRGNYYSDKHITLNKTQKEFWDFDFEQMGLFDQTTIIDFILNKLSITKIAAYIGHSEGTTQMFIGSSMNPTYFQQRIGVFVALAPVVRLDNINNKFIQYASVFENHLEDLILDLKIYNLFPRNYISSVIYGKFCNEVPDFCNFFLKSFGTLDPDIDNVSRFSSKMAHSPSGSGWRNLVHYAQIIKSKQFQRFDYGEQINIKMYNQTTPPLYDLSQINIPIIIAHGDVDQLSTVQDVNWLLNQEQSKLNVNDLLVFKGLYHFDHVSFMMAQDMTYFERDIIKNIKKINNL